MSDDQRTKFSGGELGWYQWGSFGDQFDQAIRNAEEGAIVSAMSPMGAHIVHVQQRSPEGVRVAQIGYDIAPSAETIDSLKAILGQFKAQVKDTATFNALAAQKGFQLKQTDALKPGSYFISGLQGPNVKSIVVWALTNERGRNHARPLHDRQQARPRLREIQRGPRLQAPPRRERRTERTRPEREKRRK